jgi:hypothetical protein
MENRRLLTLDEPAILAKANEIGERIRATVGQRG